MGMWAYGHVGSRNGRKWGSRAAARPQAPSGFTNFTYWLYTCKRKYDMLTSTSSLPWVRPSRVVCGVAFCAALAACGGPAWCQPAVSSPAPPKPPTVGRLPGGAIRASLGHLLANDGDGWFARVGGLGDGNGVALGGGFRTTTREGVLTTRAIVSHRESFLVGADWQRQLDAAGRWSLTAGVSERRDAQQRFSGLGAAPGDTATGYALTTRAVDVSTTWQPARWLQTTAGISAVKPTLGPSTSRDIAQVGSRFNASDLSGLALQPTYAVLHAGVSIDTRGGTRQPSGGRYSAEWRHYDDRADAGYSFDTLRLEATQDVALGSPDRLISVHAVAEQASPQAATAVPFYFLPTLGGNRSLRGYERQRFRDHSAVFVQAEYLHRIHRFASAAVFFDAGQVAPRLGAIRPESFLSDYGVGLVLGKAGGPGLRTDLALGGESAVRVSVGFSTGF